MTTTPIKRLRHLLTNGNLWLYILSLCKSHGKVYAYGLGEQIDQAFSFRPNKIMVYVVLYKLENEGLIRSEHKERRKYYTMTKKGEETLASAQEYFRFLARKL